MDSLKAPCAPKWLYSRVSNTPKTTKMGVETRSCTCAKRSYWWHLLSSYRAPSKQIGLPLNPYTLALRVDEWEPFAAGILPTLEHRLIVQKGCRRRVNIYIYIHTLRYTYIYMYTNTHIWMYIELTPFPRFSIARQYRRAVNAGFMYIYIYIYIYILYTYMNTYI